ncbi:MAG: hypothetical protein AAFY71_20625 [Bacteroidota bacterium]
MRFILFFAIGFLLFACEDRFEQEKPSCIYQLEITATTSPPNPIDVYPNYSIPKFIPGQADEFLFLKERRNKSEIIFKNLETNPSQVIQEVDRHIRWYDINAQKQILMLIGDSIYISNYDEKPRLLLMDSPPSGKLGKCEWADGDILVLVGVSSIWRVTPDGETIKQYDFPIPIIDFWIGEDLLVIANIEDLYVYDREGENLINSFFIEDFFKLPYATSGTVGLLSRNHISLAVGKSRSSEVEDLIYFSTYENIFSIKNDRGEVPQVEWRRWGCIFPDVGLDIAFEDHATPHILFTAIDMESGWDERILGINYIDPIGTELFLSSD